MKKTSEALITISEWYDSLKIYSGFPAKGTLAGALVILERLKDQWDLSIESHTAEGGSQIIGASGNAVRKILAEFGENRAFVAEGGRTNRGLRGDISAMLTRLSQSPFAQCPQDTKALALADMQRFLVDQIGNWHNKQRIELHWDDKKTTRDLIHRILEIGRKRNQDGPIAQYLVGAKLQLRYPAVAVGNESYSTADTQLGRNGDFQIRDTAFHVTIRPMGKVYERCIRNLNDGLRAYLLVPQNLLAAAKTNADSIAPDMISVESIESFVGGNIDELSIFSKEELSQQLLKLFDLYNKRVTDIEIDKSMLIEIPKALGSTRS